MQWELGAVIHSLFNSEYFEKTLAWGWGGPFPFRREREQNPVASSGAVCHRRTHNFMGTRLSTNYERKRLKRTKTNQGPPPPSLIQAMVFDQKLMEPTPGVAWTKALHTRRDVHGSHANNPPGM